jgi:hypothetical protein
VSSSAFTGVTFPGEGGSGIISADSTTDIWAVGGVASAGSGAPFNGSAALHWDGPGASFSPPGRPSMQSRRSLRLTSGARDSGGSSSITRTGPLTYRWWSTGTARAGASSPARTRTG